MKRCHSCGLEILQLCFHQDPEYLRGLNKVCSDVFPWSNSLEEFLISWYDKRTQTLLLLPAKEIKDLIEPVPFFAKRFPELFNKI